MKQRIDLLHPSKRRLQNWLDTGLPVGVGDHVERCGRCADRMETLEVQRDLDIPSPFFEALSAALRPPEGLADRILVGVEHRERADRELALIAGLFAIGVETAQVLLGEPRSTTTSTESATNDPGESTT